MIVRHLPAIKERNYVAMVKAIFEELEAQGLKSYGARKTAKQKAAAAASWNRIFKQEAVHPAILKETLAQAYKLFEEFPSIGEFLRAARFIERQTLRTVPIGVDSSGITISASVSSLIPEAEQKRIIEKIRVDWNLRPLPEARQALPESALLTKEEVRQLRERIAMDTDMLSKRSTMAASFSPAAPLDGRLTSDTGSGG